MQQINNKIFIILKLLPGSLASPVTWHAAWMNMH